MIVPNSFSSKMLLTFGSKIPNRDQFLRLFSSTISKIHKVIEHEEGSTKSTNRDAEQSGEGTAATGPQKEISDGVSGIFPAAGGGLAGGGPATSEDGGPKRHEAGDEVKEDGPERLASAVGSLRSLVGGRHLQLCACVCVCKRESARARD